MGLKAASDKTIISTHQFHFLNRHFAEGSEILLPIRTLMKIGRDPFVFIVSFQASLDKISCTCRGAVAKGADPILVYAMYLREAFTVVFRYDSKIMEDAAILTTLAINK